MPPDTWVPDPEEVQRRKDFRESHLIMSIDPKGCEDVDDALCVRKLKIGRIELGGELFYFTSVFTILTTKYWFQNLVTFSFQLAVVWTNKK